MAEKPTKAQLVALKTADELGRYWVSPGQNSDQGPLVMSMVYAGWFTQGERIGHRHYECVYHLTPAGEAVLKEAEKRGQV